jgi:hypothetical protein
VCCIVCHNHSSLSSLSQPGSIFYCFFSIVFSFLSVPISLMFLFLLSCYLSYSSFLVTWPYTHAPIQSYQHQNQERTSIVKEGPNPNERPNLSSKNYLLHTLSLLLAWSCFVVVCSKQQWQRNSKRLLLFVSLFFFNNF